MSFQFHHPGSLAEALELAARLGPQARFIAGGTDLVIQMRRGRLAPEHLIDIGALTDLAGITIGNGHCRLGALAAFRSIERHPDLQGPLRALIEAAAVIGGVQVRNAATVGGNLVNASPAADFVVPLLALDAQVELASTAGERHQPLDGFITGPGRTALRPGELLSAVVFARPPEGVSTAFLKAGRRKAMEISVVCVAAALGIDPATRRCTQARLAVGAAGPRAWRARTAEDLLTQGEAGPELWRAAGELAARDASPITDVRASADYRRDMVAVLAERALAACAARIEGVA